MDKKIKKSNFVNSIEDASILRKFTILFLLMSIIPTVLLFYLYVQIRDHGSLQISESNFNLTLTLVVIGVIVGYLAMRKVLVSIVELTELNKSALAKVLKSQMQEEFIVEGNEIAVLTQSFKLMTKSLEENVRSLELAKRTLHRVMSKIGHGISSMQNIDSFLELIIETVTDALMGKACLLMLYQPSTHVLTIKTVFGGDQQSQLNTSFSVEKGGGFEAILASKNSKVFYQLPPDLERLRKLHNFIEPPLLCSPMSIKDKMTGVLAVVGKSSQQQYTKEDMNLLFNIATQTAVAIENSKLSEDIEKTYFETISALALAVDAKDKYSRGHLDRVARYSIQIAEKLGLDQEDIKTLRDAARLHDLGKIGIADEVLLKPSSFNNQEMILMRKHPEIGESIIKPISSLRHLCDLIRHHHEKLDGSGYPDGLKGGEISPLVRILTIADIYDALTTTRPYREKFDRQSAFKQLQDMKGLLDQDIVDAFQESFER